MITPLMTAFLIVAALTLVANVATPFAERIVDRKRRRKVRLRCQIASAFLTVTLVVLGLLVQRTAQQVTSEHVAGSLSEILTKQETVLGQQETALKQQEITLGKLDSTLDQATRLGERQEEQSAALEQQQENFRELIIAQSNEFDFLNRIPLNRDLLGIEISYTPSPQRWRQIAAAYSKIESPQKDLQYADVPMIAERDGEEWNLDFEPVPVVTGGYIDTPMGRRPLGGPKKLLKLSTLKLSTKDKQLFLDVLKKAFFPLRIHWGNGTDTVLHPLQDYYPSAMYVSENKIKLILRPPLVSWNLNELKDNAQVAFFGHGLDRVALPETFRICTQDPGVILDQTIQLNWHQRPLSNPPKYDELVNPQASGTHPLIVRFDMFNQKSNRLRRCN